MRDNILFIGGCGHGKETVNGVAAKNYFLLSRIRQLYAHVKLVDTDGWKRNPLILLRLVVFLIIYRHYKIIISLNTPSAYKFVKVACRLFPNRHICYFVIGGVIADYLKEGKMSATPFSCINWFLVESYKMRDDLQALGFKNVLRVPNFKNIPEIPSKQAITPKDTIRFIFLSRIIPEKGCDDIFDAFSLLNREGWKERIRVDFYGPIDNAYKKRFMQRLSETENAAYKGFIDLRNTENYAVLASYHVMLFPTYWHGEGFPGIIIDAFIAGLPVIASDWGHNQELIENGETGLIVPTHRIDILAEKIKSLADMPNEISRMSSLCQARANEYDTKTVVSKEFMDNILHP